MTATELKIKELHPALGAEVMGVDFSRPLQAETVAEVERLWLEHHVLLFRGASIEDEAQIAFSRHFAELEIFPEADQRSARHPEIFRVANTEESGKIRQADDPVDAYLKIVEVWHTDSAYRSIPSLGAVLRGLDVPDEGGETLFANLFRAWEEMPDGLRQRTAGKVGRFSYERIRDFANPGHRKLTADERAQVPSVTHALARRHPERGGRVSLYISPLNMEGIVGMDDDDGFALIDDLTAWATRDRFVYRHKWRRGDMLMWDNRCTMHQVMPYDRRHHRRTMHRTSLAGRDPVIPAETA